jgi:hypothetical protein
LLWFGNGTNSNSAMQILGRMFDLNQNTSIMLRCQTQWADSI